jgi:transcriptional/translational regulatory protein YebC/TACO1
MFKRKGVILISLENTSSDELEEKVFETNADDFEVVENSFKIVTEVEDFTETKKFFEDAGYTLEFADLDFIPDNEVDVSDYEKALKLTKMLEAFEDDEDVDSVYTNSNIPDNIREEVEEAIEKSRFRT